MSASPLVGFVLLSLKQVTYLIGKNGNKVITVEFFFNAAL